MSSEKLSFSLATGFCRRLQSPGLPKSSIRASSQLGRREAISGNCWERRSASQKPGLCAPFVSLSPGFGESTRVPVVRSGMGLPFLWA